MPRSDCQDLKGYFELQCLPRVAGIGAQLLITNYKSHRKLFPRASHAQGSERRLRIVVCWGIELNEGGVKREWLGAVPYTGACCACFISPRETKSLTN